MAVRQDDYWSMFAGTFDEDQRYVVGAAIQKDILSELSREKNLGEVIEFGCGSGYFTHGFANNSKRVIATDLSDEMLEMAQKQLKEFQNIIFQKANCESTAFQTGVFDTVIMINLIHVIENPLNSLRECHRILKTGGKLIVASYTIHSMEELHRTGMAMRFLEKWGMPLPYFNGKLSPDQMAVLLNKAGFLVEKSMTLGVDMKALYLIARKE